MIDLKFTRSVSITLLDIVVTILLLTNVGCCKKSTQNEYPYMSEKSKPNKPKFEAVLIVVGKRHELRNERKRKRDTSCNKERKLGKKMKKMKADIKGKFLIDAPHT